MFVNNSKNDSRKLSYQMRACKTFRMYVGDLVNKKQLIWKKEPSQHSIPYESNHVRYTR